MKYYHVYILQCSDGSFYTGITNDIERRLIEHESGENKNSYTFKRRPVTLVFNEVFNDVNQA
jgi:putative endonuclease